MCEANERLQDLKRAREHLYSALVWLEGNGVDSIAEEIQQIIDDIDKEIEFADEAAFEEDRIETAVLTRRYFQDVIGDLGRL